LFCLSMFLAPRSSRRLCMATAAQRHPFCDAYGVAIVEPRRFKASQRFDAPMRQQGGSDAPLCLIDCLVQICQIGQGPKSQDDRFGAYTCSMPCTSTVLVFSFRDVM
jgi:hypothetical protein